jgi:hypothetical protein
VLASAGKSLSSWSNVTGVLSSPIAAWSERIESSAIGSLHCAGAVFYFMRDLNFIGLKKLRQAKCEQNKA